MPQGCCVPGCSGRGGARFPNDKDLHLKWRVAIKRVDAATLKLWTPGLHAVVCKKHFKPEDYRQTELGERARLKKGVVPSIFPFKRPQVLGPRKRRVTKFMTMSENALRKVTNVAAVKPTLAVPASVAATTDATAMTTTPTLTVAATPVTTSLTGASASVPVAMPAVQGKASQLMLNLSQLQSAISLATLTGQPQVVVSGTGGATTSTASQPSRLMMMQSGGQLLQTSTQTQAAPANPNVQVRLLTPGGDSATPIVLQMAPQVGGVLPSTANLAPSRAAQVVLQTGSDSVPAVCQTTIPTSSASVVTSTGTIVLQSTNAQTSTPTTTGSGNQLYQMLTLNVNGVLKTVMVPCQQQNQQPQQVVVQCPPGQPAQTMNIITSPTTNLIVQNGNGASSDTVRKALLSKPAFPVSTSNVRAQLRTALNVSKASQAKFTPQMLSSISQPRRAPPSYYESVENRRTQQPSELRIIPDSVMSLAGGGDKSTTDSISAKRNPTLTSLLKMTPKTPGNAKSHLCMSKSPAHRKRSPDLSGDDSRSLSPLMYEVNGECSDREESPPRVLYKNGKLDAVITTTPSEVIEVPYGVGAEHTGAMIPTVVLEKEGSTSRDLNADIGPVSGHLLPRFSTPKPLKDRSFKNMLFPRKTAKGLRFHNVSFQQVNDRVRQYTTTSATNDSSVSLLREDSTGFVPQIDCIYSISDSTTSILPENGEKCSVDGGGPSQKKSDQAGSRDKATSANSGEMMHGTSNMASVVRGDNLQVRIAQEIVKMIPCGREEILMIEPGPASVGSDIEILSGTDSESEDPWAIMEQGTPVNRKLTYKRKPEAMFVGSNAIHTVKENTFPNPQHIQMTEESGSRKMRRKNPTNSIAFCANDVESQTGESRYNTSVRPELNKPALSAAVSNLRRVVSELSKQAKQKKEMVSQKMGKSTKILDRPTRRRSSRRSSTASSCVSDDADGISHKKANSLQTKYNKRKIHKLAHVPRLPKQWKTKFPMLKDCSVKLENFLNPGSSSGDSSVWQGTSVWGQHGEKTNCSQKEAIGIFSGEEGFFPTPEKCSKMTVDENSILLETFRCMKTHGGDKVLLSKDESNCPAIHETLLNTERERGPGMTKQESPAPTVIPVTLTRTKDGQLESQNIVKVGDQYYMLKPRPNEQQSIVAVPVSVCTDPGSITLSGDVTNVSSKTKITKRDSDTPGCSGNLSPISKIDASSSCASGVHGQAGIRRSTSVDFPPYTSVYSSATFNTRARKLRSASVSSPGSTSTSKIPRDNVISGSSTSLNSSPLEKSDAVSGSESIKLARTIASKDTVSTRTQYKLRRAGPTSLDKTSKNKTEIVKVKNPSSSSSNSAGVQLEQSKDNAGADPVAVEKDANQVTPSPPGDSGSGYSGINYVVMESSQLLACLAQTATHAAGGNAGDGCVTKTTTSPLAGCGPVLPPSPAIIVGGNILASSAASGVPCTPTSSSTRLKALPTLKPRPGSLGEILGGQTRIPLLLSAAPPGAPPPPSGLTIPSADALSAAVRSAGLQSLAGDHTADPQKTGGQEFVGAPLPEQPPAATETIVKEQTDSGQNEDVSTAACRRKHKKTEES